MTGFILFMAGCSFVIIMLNCAIFNPQRVGFTASFYYFIWSLLNFTLFPIWAVYLWGTFSKYSDLTVVVSMVFLNVYLLSQALGALLARRYRFKNFDQVIMRSLNKIALKEKRLMMIGLVFTGLYIMAVIGRYGSLSITANALVSNAGLDTSAILKGGGNYYFSFVTIAFRFSAIMMLAIIYKRGLVWFIIATVVFFYLSMLNFSKYALLIPFVAVALLHFAGRLKSKKTIYLVIGYIAFVGILAINAARKGNQAFFTLEFSELPYAASIIIWRGDFYHGFLALNDQVLAGNISPQFGFASLALLFRVVPRSIWPDRPGSTDRELTEQVLGFTDADGWTLSFGGVGESYLNFLFIGPMIWGLMSGYVIMTFQRYFVECVKRKALVQIAILMAVPVYFMPWNMGLNDYFGRIFIFSMIFLVLLFHLRRFKVAPQ
jgi:hypothetical protein